MRYHRWYTPWLLVIPALGLVTLFSIWPAINTGVLSFTNVRQISGGRFVGFSNYIAMFQDPQLLNALINTLLYVVICVPLLTVAAAAAGPAGAAHHPVHRFLPHRLLLPGGRIGRRGRGHLAVAAGQSRPGQRAAARRAPDPTGRSLPHRSLAAAVQRHLADHLEGPRLLHDHLPLGAGQRAAGNCTKPQRSTAPARPAVSSPSPCPACAPPPCWSRYW